MSRPADPVDSYLLRVLVTLVTERNVSRTAIRLNQSQPTISIALKKLREIFGDPLLVREKGGMAPTDRALVLREHARRALGEIDAMRADADQFDPASSTQTFRIGSPDFMAAPFLAGAVENFRRQAPRARLIVHPLGADFDYERALAQGDLDVVIGNWPQPPQQLHLSVLLEDEVVCLMSSNDRRAAGGLTREQYLAARHIVPLPYSQAQRGVVETHFTSLRVSRDACVVVPFFELAPYLLVNTDLVFTTSRHFAAHFARTLPLTISTPPFDFPRMRFYQLWHERSQHSPPHRWFRDLLSHAARRVTQAIPQPAPTPGKVKGAKNS
jgi:DNA-binding transcriptional LysR family regulator